ncbi:MAG: family 20 glycosylhydrolase [Chloroflexi bacterium]|nr:family 20 glycosylhydrolase [Chloroflexota bacterium]
MPTTDLCVIPRPRQVSFRESGFRPNVDTQIALLPTADEAAFFAAQQLQAEIEEALGLRLLIIKTARSVRLENLIVLAEDPDALAAYLQRDGGWAGDLRDHGDQAYRVDIEPRGVVAVAASAVGLHYGVQTLRQVARTAGPIWPACRILDWPALRYRGLMLDVSRGKVPTLETLKLLVDRLSFCKANVLQLYTEHTFRFPHHPRIGEDCGSLSGEEILELDAYCRQRHVELMPNLNSFGHCAHVLNLPEYAHLAESAARWSLCPTDEATYEFLDDLYGDMLPAFTSRVFNVGCDETWDLGKGRSAQAVAERGTGRVYLEHILRLRELAARYGRTIQIWGDILLHYPELVAELPEDVTLLDWHYEAEEDYPSVRLFADSGRSFWVCPGTSSWNTLFPRIDNSNANIRTLAQLGAEHGAQGLLNTDWGDHGHYQPIGQCWYGYVAGAEQAWTGGQTEEDDLDARFGPLFFGLGGEEVVRAIRLLGSLNTLPGMPRRNASHSIYALLDEPLVGPMAREIPAETLQSIREGCAEAEGLLRGAYAASRDPLSIEEMLYSLRMMDYAAHKVLATQRIRADLSALAAGAEGAQKKLTTAADTLKALEEELVPLTQLLREIWLRRARRSEIEITLGHLARLRERFEAARAWLKTCQEELAAGRAPDYNLSAYEAEAQKYEILGQGFRRRMREAGVPLD